MSIEEHGAALHAVARREYEESMAERRERLTKMEAEGHADLARFLRETIAELEAIPKPWDKPEYRTA